MRNEGATKRERVRPVNRYICMCTMSVCMRTVQFFHHRNGHVDITQMQNTYQKSVFVTCVLVYFSLGMNEYMYECTYDGILLSFSLAFYWMYVYVYV